ncbi:MAG: hypothetical protein CSA42_07475 [Gammaproteobacteria bacterium]|nr:MAG: hypothetical protein CSA42_07475 [Gammaproteobacteria bacterium]
MLLSSVLTINGFHKKIDTTLAVKKFIKSFHVSFHSIDNIYQGTGLKGWNNSSWFLSVNSGCDDPNTCFLVWKQDVLNMPNFVIGRSVGIQKLYKIIRLTTEDIFKSFSIKLLPQEYQPFLSRRKGLLLYSNKNEALTSTIDKELFEYLNNPKLNISLIYYNGTMCCWTQDFSQFDLFFETGQFIKSILK